MHLSGSTRLVKAALRLKAWNTRSAQKHRR
jgi:hypothetical protein